MASEWGPEGLGRWAEVTEESQGTWRWGRAQSSETRYLQLLKGPALTDEAMCTMWENTVVNPTTASHFLSPGPPVSGTGV